MPRDISYLTSDELIAKIPAADRDAACDDDGDGVADTDMLQAVIDQACDEVDTFYSIRGVETPLSTTDNPLAKQAAIYLAIEMLYTRRGEPAERNPHHRLTEQMRILLTKVAEGKITVGPSAGTTAATTSDSDNAVNGDVVAMESEPAFTYGGRGRLVS